MDINSLLKIKPIDQDMYFDGINCEEYSLYITGAVSIEYNFSRTCSRFSQTRIRLYISSLISGWFWTPGGRICVTVWFILG